jgi:hypothetical protein
MTLFSVVYLRTLDVSNIIVCQMFCEFINNNLISFVGNKSCSNSVMLLRQPEKVVYNCYQCSCCVVRNSNVIIATVKSVFLVTAFLQILCDIPFSVSDMNG